MMNRAAESWRHYKGILNGAKDLFDRKRVSSSEMETIYRSLFIRDLDRHGIQDDFYPIGSAANHSLMYLITRCLTEFPITRVVEFGGGQTSILIDRLSGKMGKQMEITTVEQDAFWAERIRALVRHRVVCAPLESEAVAERNISFYSFNDIECEGNIELAIVDGPTAFTRSTQWDRLGAVKFLKGRLAPEFIVIFDDTERRGETEGARLFGAYLAANNFTHYTTTIRATKQQTLFCSKGFRAAAYF